MKKGLLIVVSGFSGAGKGTLIKKLLEAHDNYTLSVSMTTRAPRPGEEDGKAYFFRTEQEFLSLADKGGFVEHAEYCGNRYGTPRTFVEEQMEAGKDVLLEIEMLGALQIKERFPESLLIYVMTPSADDLQKRLHGRGTETEEAVQRRLKRAVEESYGVNAYEYVVINDDADRCAREMHEIIQSAKCAVSRNKPFIRELRDALRAAYGGDINVPAIDESADL